jgi:hypothetical protein
MKFKITNNRSGKLRLQGGAVTLSAGDSCKAHLTPAQFRAVTYTAGVDVEEVVEEVVKEAAETKPKRLPAVKARLSRTKGES